MDIIALFDANCSLCQSTKRMFQRLDVGNRVNWMSLQEYERKGLSPRFQEVDLRREIHIIDEDGKILVGYWAIRRLLLLFPLTFCLGIILHLPFSHVIGNPVYRFIAKYRYKLNKGKCDNDHCSLIDK